jgi:hypothetical protein
VDYVVPLFHEAWDRRRRRRRFLLSAALTAAALVTALLYAFDRMPAATPSSGGLSQPAGLTRLSPRRVLVQPPYMGVLCPIPNSIACDQVALAILLRRPARAVTASIAGMPLAMNRFGDELISSTRPRREFDGYLHPAGVVSRLHVHTGGGTIWLGEGAPSPVVWLLIDYGHRHYVMTHLRVTLSDGWG